MTPGAAMLTALLAIFGFPGAVLSCLIIIPRYRGRRGLVDGLRFPVPGDSRWRAGTGGWGKAPSSYCFGDILVARSYAGTWYMDNHSGWAGDAYAAAVARAQAQRQIDEAQMLEAP